MENNPSTKPAELGRHEGASQGFITGAEALMRSLEHQGVDALRLPGREHYARV